MKKRILMISIPALCVLLAVGVFAYQKWLSPRLSLELNGAEACVVEVFSEYQDDGANAYYGGRLFGFQPVDVSERDDLDLSKLGTYTVEYTSRYKDFTLSAIRKVRVVDTTPPTLDCPDEITVYEGKQPQIEYTAIDEYDGDLTGQVQSEREGDVLILRVSDSSGNTVEHRVTIHMIPDTEPPVLTLLGEVECFVRQGEEWSEPGYTALDQADGDISAQVRVEGEVTPDLTGTYLLTYTVTDAAGNSTQAERTVTVYPHLTVSTSTVPANGAVVYLTFDDGPGSYTARLLDLLDEYEAKATFFVTGQFTGYLDLIGDAFSRGHTIGVHTLTHDFAIYSSVSDYFADLGAMEEIVKEQTGSYTDVIRFPGGSSNTVSKNYCEGIMSRLVGMVEEQGYSYFDWNVSSGDTSTTDPDEIFRNVTQGIAGKQASVVLMHDIKPATIEAIPRILDWCLENGYTLAPLSAASPTAHHGVQN